MRGRDIHGAWRCLGMFVLRLDDDMTSLEELYDEL